jgi:mitochondrial ornithine carrier protein
MAENATLFWAYKEFQSLIRYVTSKPATEVPTLPLPQLALAAAGAGMVTSFVL